MRRFVLFSALVLLPGTRVAAQEPDPTLNRLAFMAGCWSGPVVMRAGTGTLEERWTPPSTNTMQGMSRTLQDDRTVDFEFMLVTADSTGAVLTPYPRGVASPDGFRLTRLAGDTAVFEAPQHDYPKRIIYARSAAGLTARIDGGAEDASPRVWTMTPAACVTGPNAPTMATAQGPGPQAPRGPERNGRVLLYVTQTLNGLWLGIAVPGMFNADDPTSYGLGLLLGAPAGILFARAVDTSKPVSLGQATAIGWGGWWGWWNGLGIYAMADNTDETDFFRNTAIGMVGGTAVGLVLARHPINAGDASLVAHASVWGTWFGGVMAVLTDADDGWPWVLGAGNAALIGAALATPKVDITAGRVWVTTASGIAGLVAGLGIDLIAQTDDDKTAILIPAITSGIGLATGMTLSRGLDRREARGPETAPEPVLLGIRDGRARLGLPFPEPTLVPRDDGRSRRFVPGMRLTLFEWTH